MEEKVRNNNYKIMKILEKKPIDNVNCGSQKKKKKNSATARYITVGHRDVIYPLNDFITQLTTTLKTK